MKVVLKSKIDQEGYLCICIINSEFHPDDSDVILSIYKKSLQISSLKLRRFYKTINVKEDMIKQNELYNRCREKVSDYLNGVRNDLEKSGLVIVRNESEFIYRHPKKPNRESCKLIDCFK